MKKITLILSLFTIINIANAQTKPKPTSKAALLQFSAWSKDNYTLEYPTAWKEAEISMPKTVLNVIAPREGADDKYKENFNLVVEDLKIRKISNINQYKMFSENVIKTYLESAKIIKSEIRKSVAAEEFYYMEYELLGSNYNINFKQYYFYKDNKGYVLTFSSELEKAAKYNEIGFKILDSFKFTK